MSLQVHDPTAGLSFASEGDRLHYARTVLRSEAAALECVADRLGPSFLRAVELIDSGTGRVAVTGTGKSADVGQKMVGTLNSTGTRAYVLDATKAMHGDLGMVHPEDIALVLSHSGESDEIVRLLGPLKQLAKGLIGLTGNARSSLARQSDVALVYGPIEEVCPLGLAPSSSTTVMIALGDALAFTLSQLRQFSREDFARYHPAGSLGKKLVKVEAVMRSGDELRIAEDSRTVREVFTEVRRKGRRTGAIMLVDAEGRLSGFFTDSDLARLFEQRREDALDRPIALVMTMTPITVPVGTRVMDAVEMMRRCKISELPVIDLANRPVGLLDITDLIGWLPAEDQAVTAA